ncbi:hypothetical protein A33M_0037 [Rhodovulum sp. PH10]|uniref:DUF3298 and DUF4163 domain-containing protein n=1 Tax=Rhodovulum sp. PH10 TaxID=1187851 RepID=UPI00027C25AA|nr:DUF3298 and DUF4163 domain-containing protein [Rhodovulum sp. PH10]EJW13707.1 hypothetical protein A33M_0037 [Rhodovulum sp. PH10]
MRLAGLLLGTALAVLAGSLCGPAPAVAETVVSSTSRAVELKLSIDDAVKTMPALFESLASEGERWLDKNRRDADKAFHDNREDFSDGRQWSFDRDYALLSTVGPYISILRRDYFYTGGAHPNTVVDTILWDTTAGKPISVRPFFQETADGGQTMRLLAKAIRRAVAVEKKKRGAEVGNPDTDDWLKGIEPSLLKLGPLALARSTEPGKSGGFTVHFSPYAVGSYAEGIYTVVIPWRVFADRLSPTGRAVFGGDPIAPKADD